MLTRRPAPREVDPRNRYDDALVKEFGGTRHADLK